jgi:hypothetical protein
MPPNCYQRCRHHNCRQRDTAAISIVSSSSVITMPTKKKKTADSTSLSTSKKNESTTAGKTVSFHLRLIMRGSVIIFL